MMLSDRKIREELVRYAHQLHAAGFVAATDGNLSVRMDSRRIPTSPTGMSKGDLKPYDLVIVGYEGTKLSGRRQASSELAMHLLIYSMRDDVQAIVHSHPPTATGFAAAGLALNQPLV